MVSNKPNENNKRGTNQMANRQRFKPGIGKQQNQMNNIRSMNTMFNANQLGDNPGFMDFNDDSISSLLNGAGNSSSSVVTVNGSDVGNQNANGNRKMNPNMKRPMKNGGPGMRHRMNRMPTWGLPMGPPNMFPGPPPAGRRGPMNPPPIPPPPGHYRNAHGGGMRMRGQQNGRFGSGPQGPMSLLSVNRPLPAPIPPMVGRPITSPHGMSRMMPPNLRQGPDGPVRRNVNGNMHGRGMGPKLNPFPRNGVATNGMAMGLNGKRTRPKYVQNREEYPLDKPWVTEEIKAEHDKKADLANGLKGHRDDALFAQFKEQRDKFVKLYDAARVEFAKKNPEQDVEKMLTESPACKQARIANVEKSNDGAVSASKVAKTDEVNCTLVSAPTKPTDATENVTLVSSTTTAITTATTLSRDSTIDTTSNEITDPAESTEIMMVAAEKTVIAKESNETAATMPS